MAKVHIFKWCISIHAPHEGERQQAPGRGAAALGISIHAPHEGERPARVHLVTFGASYFNPRSPRGGATHPDCPRYTGGAFQSTLPTRGSDALASDMEVFGEYISIHAPHEGERRPNPPPIQGSREFQSTLPTRGSDVAPKKQDISAFLFQSTLPTRGSDPRRSLDATSAGGFQSTLPTRGSDPP